MHLLFSLFLFACVVAGIYLYLRYSTFEWRGGSSAIDPQERSFEYRRTVNKGNITYAFAVKSDSPLYFIIRRENQLDRLFKWVGLCQELQARNPEFDRFTYIYCDDPVFESRLQQNHELRKAILELLEVPKLSSIKKIKGWLVIDFASTREEFANGLIASWIDVLLRIDEQVRTLTSETTYKASSIFYQRRLISSAIILSLGAYGILRFMGWAFMPNYVIDLKLQYLTFSGMVLLGITGAILLGTFYYRRSDCHRIVFFYLATVAATGYPLTQSVLSDINEDFDTSAEQVHIEPITDRYYSRGRRSTSYYLITQDWRHQRPKLKHSVNYASYQAARIGGQLQFTTHRGALGCEWISDMVLLN